MSGPSWRLDAFGLTVACDVPLPGTRNDDDARPTSRVVTLRTVADRASVPASTEPARLRSLLAFDGLGYALLQAADGRLTFRCGQEAVFSLDPSRDELVGWMRQPEDPRVQRVLLDTILWTISLTRGFEHLHAGAVEIGGRLVAVLAASGGGKSSLAAELVHRGGTLFSDDVVALEDRGGDAPIAHPGPRLMNLPAEIDPAQIDATSLARFHGETWVRVADAHLAPRPLDFILVLDRRAGAELGCRPMPASVLALLAHMQFLAAPDARTPEDERRDRTRFTIASALAGHTKLLRLSADPAVTPPALADELAIGLER